MVIQLARIFDCGLRGTSVQPATRVPAGRKTTFKLTHQGFQHYRAESVDLLLRDAAVGKIKLYAPVPRGVGVAVPGKAVVKVPLAPPMVRRGVKTVKPRIEGQFPFHLDIVPGDAEDAQTESVSALHVQTQSARSFETAANAPVSHNNSISCVLAFITTSTIQDKIPLDDLGARSALP